LAPGPSTVAGVVLAAGRSSRFGANKLVATFHGVPLLRRVVEAARASRLRRVAVVLGHEPERVRGAIADLLEPPACEAVINENYLQGQSGSVIAGLRAVGPEADAVLFLLGDQPLLTAGQIDELIAAYETSGRGIVYPSVRGKRRNPVLFARRFDAEILMLTGDAGARSIIHAHPEAVHAVEYPDERPFLDVDEMHDLVNLESNGK